jgi:hypothetical protein
MRSPPATGSRRRSAIRWSSAAGLAVGALLAAVGAAGARDRGADGEFDRRESSHFVLLQDVDIDESGGFRGSRRFEQEVLDDLEGAYQRLDALLGLRPPRKLEVVIYDPGVFDARFAGLFRFAAAGFYHGVIRVRGAEQATIGLSQVLHHELVHAALDAAAPSFAWPGWLNEGLAEWFEDRALGKRGLDLAERRALESAWRAGMLVPLASLSVPGFSGLAGDAARAAYLESYGMIDFLVRRSGERALREFCQEVVRSRDLERAARRVFRRGLGELEADFFAELR